VDKAVNYLIAPGLASRQGKKKIYLKIIVFTIYQPQCDVVFIVISAEISHQIIKHF